VAEEEEEGEEEGEEEEEEEAGGGGGGERRRGRRRPGAGGGGGGFPFVPFCSFFSNFFGRRRRQHSQRLRERAPQVSKTKLKKGCNIQRTHTGIRPLAPVSDQ
jgi:hypothetical protein